MGKVFRNCRRARNLRWAGAAALVVALAACSSSTTSGSAHSTTSGSPAAGSPAAGSPAAGGTAAAPKGQLVVFADSSLADAFAKIGTQFEHVDPNVSVKFNFNGSSALAAQIKDGASADVFASANTATMDTVTGAGLASGTPRVIAKNQGEIVVPAGNPNHISSVHELANPSVKLSLCAAEVPCGALAQEIFKKAGIAVKPVSEEQNVSEVVNKISQGAADAGIVYVTDLKSAGSKLSGVPVPSDQNDTVSYPIVEVKNAPNASAATAFMDYVLSPAGLHMLYLYGFITPTS
jgi:molybdate transport system substrate-binding protein